MGDCAFYPKSIGNSNTVMRLMQNAADGSARVIMGPNTKKSDVTWQIKSSTEAGWFEITSDLDGSHLTFQEVGPATFRLSTMAQVPTPPDAVLWQFLEDPNGSGYCFIENKALGYVILEAPAPTHLSLVATNLNGDPPKLWKTDGEGFPKTIGVDNSMSYSDGTGGGTTGGGGQECAFSMNVTLNQDGTCHCTGSYTNRGDTILSTAPPQCFAVGFTIHDMQDHPYCFVAGGWLVSAPQEGSSWSWDVTAHSSLVFDNWSSIILRSQRSSHIQNAESQGLGPAGNWCPDGTAQYVEGLMQSVITVDGPINDPASIIVWTMNQFSNGVVQSGGSPGQAGGSFPPGWQPSGAASVPVR
jgi:hypothetical protein